MTRDHFTRGAASTVTAVVTLGAQGSVEYPANVVIEVVPQIERAQSVPDLAGGVTYEVELYYTSRTRAGTPVRGVFISSLGAVETPGRASFVTPQPLIEAAAIYRVAVPQRSRAPFIAVVKTSRIDIRDQITRFEKTKADLFGRTGLSQQERFALAKAAYGLGDDETAIALLTDLIASTPLVEPLLLRARSYVKLGRFEPAIADLRRAAQTAGGEQASDILIELGRVLRLAGLYVEAQSAYIMLAQIAPLRIASGRGAVASRINDEDVRSHPSKYVVAISGQAVYGIGAPQAAASSSWMQAIVEEVTPTNFPPLQLVLDSGNFTVAEFRGAISLNDIAAAIPAFNRPQTNDDLVSSRSTFFTPWFGVKLNDLGFNSSGVELHVAFALSGPRGTLNFPVEHPDKKAVTIKPFRFTYAFLQRFHLNGQDFQTPGEDFLQRLPDAKRRRDRVKDLVLGSLKAAAKRP
jgi:tetratricopeptide (TPR) repeat protein